MLPSALLSVGIAIVARLAYAVPPPQALPIDLEKRNSTGCLPRFHTDKKHFEKCKSNICFLFISERPVRARPLRLYGTTP